MSETTNLKLFKHDNPSTNENQFDVNKALNQNWDKLDEFAGEVNDKVIEIEDNIEGQGLDIDELQQKTEQIEENISDIQQGQKTQNTEIENLQTEVQELNEDIKANALEEETEQAKSLKITDASGARGSLKVLGNDEQDGEPSLNSSVPIKCLGSNINLYPGWEKNTISSETGKPEIDPNYIRSVDFISVLPNKNYTIKAYNIKEFGDLNTAARMYDINKNYLSSKWIGSIINKSITFTLTNADVRYIKIVCSNNNTVTNTAKVDIKLEEGEVATSYSPHGQGSTEIKKINKNLYKLNVEGITKRGVNYSINNESIIAKRVESATSGSYFTTNRIKIPAGTYTFSGIDSSFVYANARVEIYATTDGDSKLISSISSTKLFYTHTFDKATEISFILVVTAATEIGNTYTFKPQVEVGSKNTEIVEHQEENYILEIQQEMLTGDYFDLERKKEVHNKEKIILNGSDDENWALSSSFSNVFTCNKPSNIKQYETDLICNITNNFVTSGEALNSSTDGIAVGSKINFKMANINTLEELKQYLNTTNIELYYRTTETTELDLTGSQIEVLEKLNKLRYYKGVNNIMTTEDIALLQAKYSQNLKVTNTKMQQQIDEIKELLSTTQTSAMLLDNLEEDLIEEVK